MAEPPDHAAAPAWLSRFDIRDLGTITGIVARVQAVVVDEKSSLHDLSRVLQNDPTLVSRVLRIANSPGYMVTPEPVTTITRASSLIGFDAIRNICITNRLLDALLEDRQLGASVQERLLRRVAASLHAAAQARMLLAAAGTREREEAFLAALLERVGEGAFWSTGGEAVEALDAALAEPGCDERAVVRAHLGADFAELSRALIRNWGLQEAVGPLDTGYRASHAGPGHASAVQLANEVADTAAQEGWQSARMKTLVGRAAKLLGIEADEALLRLSACAKQAEDLAACYGAAQLARRMRHRVPPPAPPRRPAPAAPPGATAPRAAAATGGAAEVLLRVLRRLASLEAGAGSDVNTVIRTAMEGAHEGIGMERTLTALLTPDRRELQVRFWLGEGGEEWSKGFQFRIGTAHDVVNDCLNELQSAHHEARNPGKRVPPALLRFCAGQDFVVAPVAVGNRSIGLIYADRAPGGGAITGQEFGTFVHLARELGNSLARLSQPRT